MALLTPGRCPRASGGRAPLGRSRHTQTPVILLGVVSPEGLYDRPCHYMYRIPFSRTGCDRTGKLGAAHTLLERGLHVFASRGTSLIKLSDRLLKVWY
jgi:hypothetical protein